VPHGDGGTSGSLILALSFGVPVVAADRPSYRDLLANGEAGWLFAAGDSESLARALDVAFSAPEEELRRRAERAAAQAAALEWGSRHAGSPHFSTADIPRGVRQTKHRVLVIFRAGPTWGSGPPEDQPDWDAHADWVDALIDAGTFVMGGPLGDYSGSVSLLEGLTAVEARELIATDPFVENGVFVIDSVRDWTVYVDELSANERA
jgi:uncharacterized protein YciI